MTLLWFVENLCFNLIYLFLLLFAVAYFTLLERKIMASVQRRTGPRVVGFYGVLQPLADGVKLLTKEIIFPQKANKLLFLLAPLLAFFLAFSLWCVIPFFDSIVFADIDMGLLFIFAVMSLNIYALILSGWASNSKYAFLGALRSTAQVIAYELATSFIIVIIVLLVGSLNITEIVFCQQRTIYFCFPCLPLFIIFMVTMVAETNRVPFDLVEAEAEIVAGYNVEYSSILFAFFFLAEYANMFFMSFLITILFLGGWHVPFVNTPAFSLSIAVLYAKIMFFVVFFVLIRSTLPRYRYDQLMSVGWELLLPMLFGFFFFYVGISPLFQLTPAVFIFPC